MSLYRIKPLEWDREILNPEFGEIARADTRPTGADAVVYQDGVHFTWGFKGRRFPTADEAKAAAESYYRSRLLEALEPATELRGKE